MNNRRAFLKNTAVLSGALLLSKSSFSFNNILIERKISEVGLQLFTIREALTKDVKSSIKNVSSIGYKHVETFYGYAKGAGEPKFWGLTVKELKTLLNDNQLKTYSGHYQLNDFLTKGNGEDSALKYQIEIAATLGQKYLIVPIPPLTIWDKMKAEDFQYMASQLNKAAEIAKKSGIKIGYHNHFWEFRTLADGNKGYDILLKETDPKLVSFEMDLFWVKKSGIKPEDYFAKYPHRFPMWHVKDMDKNNTAVITGGALDQKPSMEILKGISYAEVGSGNINYAEIFKHQEESGLQHIFVEQDVITKDPFVSIKESFDYVKNSLLK
ncbi:sugar phosphate isomerase/epimerase family protein [Pedobacter mucosus]|uniref:sugar phosphate isomerase/epimerase family protein n=1 Tax=Pedobacter mucosus TaxID=2895286 RepID=UPI001EE3BA9D|nr:sugar phosphate isomerase/epimerase [Pedobacter mucosus]UKT63427.1 sugar phosphate isomerase/epimerase [Pedobacter mucosus]